MKKKRGVLAAAAILVAGMLIYFLLPATIIKDQTALEIHRIVHYAPIEQQNDIMENDITERVELDLLKQALASCKRSRISTAFAPYQLQNIDYEIDGIYHGQPIHFIVGEINIVYASCGQGGYRIKNGGALLAAIESLAKP